MPREKEERYEAVEVYREKIIYALRLRIRDFAHARPRFGYQRIWVVLRREGWLVNRKRVCRHKHNGLASGSSSSARRPVRAVEHGFCAGYPRRRSPGSNLDGGR